MPRPSELPTYVHFAKPRESLAEQATIPPQRVPWITRMRETRTSVDPKATVSYVVARDIHRGPTLVAGQDVPYQVREDFASGTLLQDRYRLIKELGRGGMGVVYLGRDQRLDRSVAVKVILSQGLSAHGASATMDSQAKTSFADEARLGASLTHPAIATVFDFGFQNDNPFTVFEYIEGETLRELIERRGRLPLDEVRLIVGPLAQALDFAHARRIVHRDLKPENIRATEQRQFKVLDLGLAREFSRHADWRFAGTPAYAAPEQAAERPSDGRTDQYALAVIVFELLTGRRPFLSDSWLDLLEMHFSASPPRPRSLDPDMPHTVEEAILKGLEKDPNQRFSTCTELAVALGCQFLTGPAPLPRILLETDIKKMGGRWKTVYYPVALKRPRTHLAMAPDALWAIHRTELMRWPLAALYDLRSRGFRGMSFRIRGVAGKDRQWFRFKSRSERRRWLESFQSLIPAQEQARDTTAAAEFTPDPRVEPVVLLRGRPGTRFQLLGMVEAKGPNKRRAENGLAIRAAMMGADAVVDLNAERLPGFVRTEHRASGTAVRAVDEEGRMELKSRWFARQIAYIGIPMLLLAFLFGGISEYFKANVGSPAPPEHNHPFLAGQQGTWLNAAFWIIISTMTLGMVVLRWPQLVRPTAICFLAKAAQNGLAVVAGLVGIAALGMSLLSPARGLVVSGDSDSSAIVSTVMISSIAANVLWASSLAFFYLYLGRRAWRIDQEFRKMAAGTLRSTPIPRVRRLIGILAWCLAIAFALSLVAWQTRRTYQIIVKRIAEPTGSAQAGAQPKSAFARTMNQLAWQQLTDPDLAKRLPAAAVKEAEQAVFRTLERPRFTLRLGRGYRTGDYSAAIESLERSIKLGGFDAHNGYFLAAAHAANRALGSSAEAILEADRWMRANRPNDNELKRFREVSAAVLYTTSASTSRKVRVGKVIGS